MAPRARKKASKAESEKGKLAGRDEHDKKEAAPDSKPSKKRKLKSVLRSKKMKLKSSFKSSLHLFMVPRARKKASKAESEKGKLAGRNEHDKKEAAHDPKPSKKRKLKYVLRSKKRKLKSVLRHCAKDELLNLLVHIATKIPSADEEIRAELNLDPQIRKLFVRFLKPTTTSKTLCAAFSSFGEIEEGFVMRNPVTRKSRCRGLVTFKNFESAQKALVNPHRMIDDKLVQCFPSEDRDIRLSRKLHVGGLPLDVSTKTLASHLSKYGEIEECEVFYDKEKSRSMGFGFVTFKTIEGARKANRDPKKFIGETRIYVNYAESKPWKTNRQRIMPSESIAPHAIARPRHSGEKEA